MTSRGPLNPEFWEPEPGAVSGSADADEDWWRFVRAAGPWLRARRLACSTEPASEAIAGRSDRSGGWR